MCVYIQCMYSVHIYMTHMTYTRCCHSHVRLQMSTFQFLRLRETDIAPLPCALRACHNPVAIRSQSGGNPVGNPVGNAHLPTCLYPMASSRICPESISSSIMPCCCCSWKSFAISVNEESGTAVRSTWEAIADVSSEQRSAKKYNVSRLISEVTH